MSIAADVSFICIIVNFTMIIVLAILQYKTQKMSVRMRKCSERLEDAKNRYEIAIAEKRGEKVAYAEVLSHLNTLIKNKEI